MGARHELPTGTVTFLFSDIEGSTRLLRQLGPRYAEALAEHQRLLRETFDEHGGREIDTQGDSFFVAFRRAKDAVAAAVAGQIALAEHEWPDDAELRVRMGIHTGEPIADKDRYVGLGVHRAARIGAAAVGGQVLVSETTRSLLRDDPPAGVTLRDLGKRRLKDMTEPERLFEVKAPGLAAVERRSRPRTGSRRPLVIGVALVAIVLAAALGVLFSRGSASAAAVQPNEVGVIDGNSGSSKGHVSVGAAPNGVAAGAGAIWVANTDDDSVTRINPDTNTREQTIKVGSSPVGVAVSPNAVWVANAGDGTVSWINTTTNGVVKTVDVGNGPEGVAYGDRKVWVANAADGTLSEINASGNVERTVPGAVGVTALTVAFGHVWLVAPASGAVIERDPQSGGSTTISVGHDPAAITAAAGAIWVANRQDGSVWKIDPRSASVTAQTQVGAGPDAIAGSTSAIWVANGGDGTLSKIDPGTDPKAEPRVVKTLSLSNPPQGLALFNDDLYVSVRSNGTTNRGGTLRAEVGWGSPDFFDPTYAYTPTSWAVLAMTNDGLVGFRRVGGAEGTELVPDLAQALPAPTDGGRTYTFTLRPGIRYSTGGLVRPDDIKAEIERALAASNTPSVTRVYWTSIVGANECSAGKPCHLSAGIVTSPRTITFHLTQPDADFLTKLALPPAFAVPAGTPAHPQGEVPATGPYVATYDKKHGVVRLARNQHFHLWSADAQPDGFPDRIEISWPTGSESPDRAVSAFVSDVKKGSSDVAAFSDAPPLPKSLLDELATRFPSQLKETVRPATWYFFLNTRVPPFDDVRVRRAVAEAFDRQAFGRLLTTQYTTTCNILPQGYPGYRRGCPGGSASSHLRDARAVIRGSGQERARVVVWVPAPLAFEARYMASLLDSLGFRARVHAVPAAKTQQDYWPKILDARTRVQIGYIGWIGDYPSSLAFFEQQVSCAAFTPDNWQTNTNVAGFCDPRIDAEIHHAAQVQALDPPAATLLWQKAERDIRALAPMIPTYNGRAITFVSKRVGNFQYNPQWGPLLDQLWVR